MKDISGGIQDGADVISPPGIANRYAFRERLAVALDIAGRQGRSVAVLYIGVDRAKRVDAEPDATMLAEAASRIAAEIGPSETLAHIYADEFAVILTNASQPERAVAVATRVIQALRKPFERKGRFIEGDVALGLSFYPDDGTTAHSLKAAAIEAMRRCRSDGGDALCVHHASMESRLQKYRQLKCDIDGAIARYELVLHYQPIVSGLTGEVEAFEALIRWQHPIWGEIAHDVVMPLVEDVGLVEAVGRWIVDTAISDAASWPQPWRISIDVSAAQLRLTDVSAVFRQALDAHALAPERVTIEVADCGLREHPVRAISILNRLRQLGVRIALDGFGAGLSSLGHLRMFRFDAIKMDGSLVDGSECDDKFHLLLEATVSFLHLLGLSVAMEGVESREQFNRIRSLDCDQIQGSYIAKPAPVNDLAHSDRQKWSKVKSMWIRRCHTVSIDTNDV